MRERNPDPDMLSLMEESEPDFEEVMTCVFGIQPHETRTYLELIDHPESTAEELADVLDRDRSNVNRSLTSLIDLGLVERKRRLLDAGGYVYQYTATPLPEAQDLLHEALDTWTEQVNDVIDEFGENR